MSDPTVTHGNFTIVRHYKASPAKAFDAFRDPTKKRRWFAESTGFHVDSFDMDFRVGGTERACFRFVADKPIEEGTPCINDTVYMDIVEDARIVTAYTMTVGEARISSSLATVEFLPDGTGSKLIFTEQAAFFAGGDGIEMRRQGWEDLIERLARFLEGTL